VLKSPIGAADTSWVSRERTLEKIMAAFAEAVAAGDFEKAEGWLAVARLSQERLAGADARAH
jgi:iron uptake system EfeUOB component EfeO/EfeM